MGQTSAPTALRIGISPLSSADQLMTAMSTGGRPNPSQAPKEEDARHAARSGMVQVLTILLQAVTTGTQVIFARFFGPTLYGMYQAMIAVVELAGRAGPGGADKGMLRYVAGARAVGNTEGVRRALGSGLRLGLTVSAVVSLGVWLGADAIAAALDLPGIAPGLRIVAFVPPFSAVLLISVQATLAARVTRVNFLLRGLVEPTVLLTAGVGAWILHGQLRGLAAAHLTSSLATAALAVWALRNVFSRDELRGIWHAPRVPGFNRFSLTMSAAELFNVAFQRADLLILTAYLGAKGTAVYAAAEFITRVIANIRYAFDAIVAGVMAEALETGDRDRLRYNLHLATRWVVSVAALLAVVVVVLRRDLLTALYGSDYVDGAVAVVILAGTHLVSASWGLVSWVLVASGRSRFILLNNFLGASFNVAASLWLIPRLGFTGGAIASLGTMIVVLGSALIEVWILEKVSPFSVSLLKPLAAAAAACGAGLFVSRLITRPALRISAVVSASVIAYGLVLLVLGLPAEERRWVGQLRRRVAALVGKA